jgi:hypothetical protein
MNRDMPTNVWIWVECHNDALGYVKSVFIRYLVGHGTHCAGRHDIALGSQSGKNTRLHISD